MNTLIQKKTLDLILKQILEKYSSKKEKDQDKNIVIKEGEKMSVNKKKFNPRKYFIYYISSYFKKNFKIYSKDYNLVL